MAYTDDPIDMDEPEAEEPMEAMPAMPEQVAAEGKDLAFEVDDQKLGTIATKCLDAYKRDKEERADWEEGFDKIMAMVSMGREAKEFPWPGASNVKYPMIMRAALKFGSRAYPAIVNGSDVVKSASVGKDKGGAKRLRGDRVCSHMNYQLLLEMPEWDSDTDRLCHSLPLQGTMFRQVIWDSEYTRPLTTLLNGKEFVVTQGCKDLETVPHYAKEFPLFIHQIKEKQRRGSFRDIDIGLDEEGDEEKAGEQEMLECHCRYDLDEDGYAEPYIAVIHKESEKVLSLKPGWWPDGVERGQPDEENPYGRIVRIRRHVEFIKYGFLPHPEGLFYDIGFGQLLLEHNEIVNAILNQLIDAATDQNAGGGFIARGFNSQTSSLEFNLGEWKNVNIDADDIRKAFFPRPTSQPSPAMFQLLQLIVEASRDLASDQDVTSGNAPANTPATTVLAMIEQGMQVFSSIYKRIYRSLTAELRLIAKLNGAYLPPEVYQNILDEPQEVGPDGQPMPPANPQQDYAEQDKDIIPVADPSMTTSAQKLARAQFLMQVGAGNPILDQKEIMRRVLEAAAIDNIETLMPEPDPAAVQQQQDMEKQQMQVMLRQAMADILETEAGAAESAASARLKEIQGNIEAQEHAINLAAMRISAWQLMGGMYGPQANGPGMGGMGGVPDPALGGGVLPGAGGPIGPAPQNMGGPPMGQPGPGPGGPVAGGGPGEVNGVPQPVPAGPGGY